MFHEIGQVQFALKVNGVIQPQKFNSAFVAEQAKQQYPTGTLVEVVPVTEDGKQVLFG